MMKTWMTEISNSFLRKQNGLICCLNIPKIWKGFLFHFYWHKMEWKVGIASSPAQFWMMGQDQIPLPSMDLGDIPRWKWGFHLGTIQPEQAGEVQFLLQGQLCTDFQKKGWMLIPYKFPVFCFSCGKCGLFGKKCLKSWKTNGFNR